MTKVKEILRARQYAGFTQAVQAKLDELGIDRFELARRVYGEKGEGRSQTVHNILRGKSKAAPKTLAMWAPVLGMGVEELVALYDLAPPPEPEGRLISPKRALEAFMGKPLSPVTRAPDTPITLTVDTQGFATLRLSLPDIPLARALKIIELLALAKTEEDSL